MKNLTKTIHYFFSEYRSMVLMGTSFLGLVFFIFDRVLKTMALSGQIIWHQNYYLALSINLGNINLNLFFLTIVTLLVLLFLGLIYRCRKKNSDYWEALGVGLIVLGALSNLIDRLRYGFVIDYLNFYFFYNNLADILLWAGVVVWIWGNWDNKRKKELK